MSEILDTSAPICPDIILDGTQLILRLDHMHDPIQTPDNLKILHHDNASSIRESIIGSCQDLQDDGLLPQAVHVPAYIHDVLETIADAPNDVDDGVGVVADGAELSMSNLHPEQPAVVDFSIGEQILTVTQQVSIDPAESAEKEEEQKFGYRLLHTLWNGFNSYLGLITALLLYTFLGAALFHYIENVKPPGFVARLHQNLSSFAELQASLPTLSEKSMDTNGSVQLDVADIKSLLMDYERILLKVPQHHYYSPQDWQPSNDYWKWLLFCVTTYTTIGYGHIVPTTGAGKIACIIYSVIGIPLFLMTIGKLGKLFTKGVKWMWSYVRQLYYIKFFRDLRQARRLRAVLKQQNKGTPLTSDVSTTTTPNGTMGNDHSYNKTNDCEAGSVQKGGVRTCQEVVSAENDSKRADDTKSDNSYRPFIVDDTFDLPQWVSIIVWAVYILFGASMYSFWETSWSYLDAVYFVFISISTIGFGDIVPTQNFFFLATSVYILFGLALVAMIISGLAEFFTKTIEHVHKTVTHIHVPAILRRPISAVHLQESSGDRHFAMNALPPVDKKKKLRVRFKRQRRASL